MPNLPKFDKNKAVVFIVVVVAVVMFGLYYFGYFKEPVDWSRYSAIKSLGVQTKFENCQVRGPLPDPDCTPGGIFPVPAEQICVPGYSRSVRNVSTNLKKRVYEQYGLSYPQPRGAYEADHLIPLQLGGNNDLANLFPEVGEPRPGYHEKDLIENYLHTEVCAGRLDLSLAQKAIATDWLDIYDSLSPAKIWELEAQYRSFGN